MAGQRRVGRTFLKLLGGLVALLLVGLGGTFLWAKSAVEKKLEAPRSCHESTFAIPTPLSTDEAEAVRAKGGDPMREASVRAIARGKHLVEARYACSECHGSDFAGGTMVDDAAIGRFFGPNLTQGKGSVTLGYSAQDWDRIVRHGIRRDGKAAVMPSEDFQKMSDQELADIVSFIGAQPPIDKEMPAPELGPVGTVLVALGKLPLSCETIRDHQAEHVALPPKLEATIELGEHLIATCTGCHGQNLAGGPILGGDPAWPPAANLTPDASGLSGWTYDDFKVAMTNGTRKNGQPMRDPMSRVVNWTKNAEEAELRAMWLVLEKQPKAALGAR